MPQMEGPFLSTDGASVTRRFCVWGVEAQRVRVQCESEDRTTPPARQER